MTTSTTTPRVAYTADGSTASYSFNFEIADSSSIAVYEGATKKTLTTHYTISFDSGTSGTGSVVFASAPSDSTVITLIRDTNLARTTDFTQSGAFLADTVNAELDRLSQAVIDATDKIENQAVSTAEPNTDTATLTIPNAATRANKVLSFDSSGNAQVTTDGGGSVTSVTAGTGLSGGTITGSGTIAIDTATTVDKTTAQTLTNKTINADNNTISNLEVDNIKAATLVTESEGIGSNDNDTTLPTSAAVKDYVDNNALSASATQTLTNKTIDADNNTISNLEVDNFNAATIVNSAEGIASNQSDTKIPTVSAVKAYADSVSITSVVADTTPQLGGNLDINGFNITSARSNENIVLDPNGTGKVSTPAPLELTADTSTSPNLLISGGGSTGDFLLKLGNSPTRANQGNSIFADGAPLYLESNNGNVILQNTALTAAADKGIVFETTAGGSGNGTIIDLNLDIVNNKISSKRTNEDIELIPNGTGVVKTPKIQLNSDSATIQSLGTNQGIILSTTGTGDVAATSDIIANGDLIATSQVKNSALQLGGDSNNQDAFIQGRRSNENITIDPAGTGTIVLNAATTAGGNIAMGGNTITGLNTGSPSADGDVAHKKYVDDSVAAGLFNPASTQTLTNKNIDADNNTISNIEVDNFKAASIIIESEGIGSNDNDTTLPTSAAVIDYVSGEISSGIANQILLNDTKVRIQDSGSNGTITMTVDNSTKATITEASGFAITAPTTMSSTLGVTGASTLDGVTITDNTISTNASNANLEINANGSGTVTINGLSFPTSDGSADQVLKTDGSGNLSFVAQSGGTSLSGSTNNTITTVTGANAMQGEANLTFDGSTLAVTGAATVSTTLGVTGASTLDGVTITDNTISTNASNANLEISANGSGVVRLDGNVDIQSGLIDLKNSGSVSQIKLYCESNNAHAQTLQSAPHSESASNTLTLPSTGGNSVLVSNSSTSTLTNKTIDANGTGNNISNIDIGNMTAAVIVTESEGIGSNDNDTTIPTSAAVKAYADSVGGGGGGVSLSGSTNNTIATVTGSNALAGEANLTFDGSTLAVTGAATISTTLGVTGASTLDGITITDNTISTNASNADLVFGTNGTGRFGFSVDGSDFWNDALYQAYFGSVDHVKTMGISRQETVDANSAARNYMIGVAQTTTLSGSSSSNSNFRPRTLNMANSLDMAGHDYTKTGQSRGPKAGQFVTNVVNSGTDSSTLQTAQGGRNYVAAYDDGSTYAAGNLTVTDAIACSGEFELYKGGGSGNFTFTNAYSFTTSAYVDNNHTITNLYGYHFKEVDLGNSGSVTNKYAFYDASTGATSLIGGVTFLNGDVTTEAVSIADNCIKTNRSNDHLYIQANGTGSVVMAANGGDFANALGNSSYTGANAMLYEDLSQTLGGGTRTYKNVIAQDIKFTSGQNSSNSNDRWRNRAFLNIELNGSSSTATSSSYRSRGPVGLEAYSYITNNSSTNATLGQASGGNYGVSVYPGSSGNLTMTNLTGMGTYFELSPSSGDLTITDAVGYESIGIDYYHNGTTASMTDFYHFRAGTHSKSNFTLTNDYAFFTEEATAQSQFGAVRLMNQSGDPSGVADMSHIYAKDDGSSSEVYVRDEAGNVTKISPHNEAGEWEYYSKNSKTGKTVRINMEKLVAEVEKLSGKSFIESE